MNKKKKNKKDKNGDSVLSPHSQNQSSTDPDSSNSGEMNDFSSENFVDSILYAPPIPQQEVNINYTQPQPNMYNVQGGSPYNHNNQPGPYQNPQQMPYQQIPYNNGQQQQVIYNNMPQQQISYNNGQPSMISPQKQGDKSLFGQTEMVASQYIYVDQNGNQVAQPHPQGHHQPNSQAQQSVYFVDTSMHIQVYPQLHSQKQAGQR